jgi:hypothetical protein
MNRPAGTEQPRSRKAERDDVPLGWARHRLFPGHLPLHGVSEWRELSGLDKTAQHRAGHIGPHPVRHGGGEPSSGTTVRPVVVLRVQESEGNRMRRRRKNMRE